MSSFLSSLYLERRTFLPVFFVAAVACNIFIAKISINTVVENESFVPLRRLIEINDETYDQIKNDNIVGQKKNENIVDQKKNENIVEQKKNENIVDQNKNKNIVDHHFRLPNYIENKIN
eukprot:CAMPEP_0194412556 /NCGR_PEP_ID=MMETSP0176-20130528/11039_1 /TAXON_ID=216777 /ORGANISM="Proboscia alata, Strain PI-D3" /LENGTH=118 /DNA_ID=CAMNT_0039215379 /DNA_START=106 /DNA_END=459 /DNA_ORIENTATION=-